MKAMRYISVLAVLILIITGSANAQYSLAKRHQIGLHVGMWNQSTGVRTEIGPGSVVTAVESSGVMGGLSYGHWFEENLALNIYAGSMVADVETAIDWSAVTSETANVVQVLFGIKYYFLKSTLDGQARPFFKASAGPFIGSQSTVETGLEVITESRTETVIGGKLEAGSDFILGRHFMFGVALGYNLMSEFSQPIGGSRDYSGIEFSLGFSYLFGRGVN